MVSPGGAERLLFREFENFSKMGYDVEIVSYFIADDISMSNNIPKEKLISLGGVNTIESFARLLKYILRNRDAIYLCNSGYVDLYLASLLTRIKYSMHIHQPSFMSFNETDKYSFIHKKAFEKLVSGNFGAKKFIVIKKKMSFLKKIKINLRAFISYFAVRKAEHIFVLSDYAVREKRELYGVDAHFLCGALEKEMLEYKPKTISDYKNYDTILLAVARLDKHKRIDELLYAFSEFLKESPNSILLIGGKGEEEQNLRKISDNLNINSNVRFLGFISDEELPDYYALADLFISLDWGDFRITAFEALAAGTKVLLSNETDADSILEQTGYFYLSAPERISAYEGIKLALKSETKFSDEEMKKLLEKYVWDNYFKDIIKYIDPANLQINEN